MQNANHSRWNLILLSNGTVGFCTLQGFLWLEAKATGHRIGVCFIY